jgi:hypothetical protein
MLAAAGRAQARLLLSQKEALALAFPSGVAVERRTAYLSAAEVKQAEKAGRVKIDSRVWVYYVGTSSRGVMGYAYFETHVVRTMTETFMAVLEPDGSLRSVELLAFAEPDDYLPGPRWLAQFKGRSLKDDLLVHRVIRNMTGASLTSQAMADGVRRVLAVHAAASAQNSRLSGGP